MKREQIALGDLFTRVREAESVFEEITRLLDERGIPGSEEGVKALALEIANLVTRRVFEAEGMNKPVGVELEFRGGRPRIAFYEAGGCAC